MALFYIILAATFSFVVAPPPQVNYVNPGEDVATGVMLGSIISNQKNRQQQILYPVPVS
jgi:hypothetical protein